MTISSLAKFRMSKRACPGTPPNLENRMFKKHKIDNNDPLRVPKNVSKHVRIPSTLWSRQNQSRDNCKTVTEISDNKTTVSDHHTFGSDHKTPGSDHSKRNRVVYIGNLSSPDRTTLLNLLRFYGPVRKLWLAKCGTFGFVWFSSATDASMAKTRLNGAKVGEKKIIVNWADKQG